MHAPARCSDRHACRPRPLLPASTRDRCPRVATLIRRNGHGPAALDLLTRTVVSCTLYASVETPVAPVSLAVHPVVVLHWATECKDAGGLFQRAVPAAAAGRDPGRHRSASRPAQPLQP